MMTKELIESTAIKMCPNKLHLPTYVQGFTDGVNWAKAELAKEYQTSRLYLDGYMDAEKHYLDVIDSQHKLVDEEKVKVKEIIKDLLSCCRNYPQENVGKIQRAEQFLRETDIDDAIQKENKRLNLDKIAEEIEQDVKEQSSY